MTVSTPTATPVAVKDLQASLVELLDLGLQVKQAHWNITGPRFRALHLQLDELAEEHKAWQDDVAERINALDHFPDGRAATVAATSDLDAFPDGPVRDERVVELLLGCMETVTERFRRRIMGLDEDPVSQDLLIGIAAGLEKQRWMLRAQTL
jgi:starvation-inducible DNA-binding protein